MTCEIRISDTAFGWEVEPVALSASSFEGEYEFTVSKVSKGGTAVSSQSGDFATVPGEPVVLGTAVFDRKGSIAAELTVRWSGGAVSCERRYPGSDPAGPAFAALAAPGRGWLVRGPALVSGTPYPSSLLPAKRDLT